MPPIVAVAWLGELAGLAITVVTDLRYRIIPNCVVLVLAANGMVLRLLDWGSWRQPTFSLLTAGAVLLLFGQLARLGVIGGGDAKLIAAVTLLVPLPDVPALLIAIALAGGVVSCLYLALRGIARAHRGAPPEPARRNDGTLMRVFRRERRRTAAGQPMPYALAIFLGTGCFGISLLLRCFYATRCLF